MNEEQVTLQALREFIEKHPSRVLIENAAKDLRSEVAQGGDITRLAIALVGAEMAAE